MTLKKLKAALEKARKAQWDDSVEVKADEAVIKTADLAALIAVAEAAQDFIDQGREWIGGAKYCPECLAEGWHYEGCKSGQAIWDSRKALADALADLDWDA
jgi:hypothetical protein